ncbi:MAG TPA: cation:proton antiporter [Pyrinomonadaceae bacterium]|nr:cation:proton antiporter [Chloracidobacterium sp.]HBE83245.1 sodium:proton exchanger [Blastocatellia bacterium]HRJ90445.1 cation:proton antiporter [Pyrinomonadaceae bacterium]HRK52150.1 cation:proton antiporter [Pyrinomonadaceae bacterium]
MHSLSMPYFLAAGAVPQFLTESVALIVAGALIAYICFRLKLVPIVGFLLAGVLIGPNALAIVKDQALVDATAEIGVILLLFTIGIEFSLEKLAKIQRLIFGGGMMQVGFSVAATAFVLSAFGVDWKAGIFTGMLVALSSTAIVLKLLADNGETNSEPGQVSLGLLIFQDLAIVVMVLLVPILAGSEGGGLGDIGIALATAGLIIAAVLVITRRVMPKILEAVAMTCSPELFLLTVIAICFGTAYLTSLAGVSLSLGAFLAGLMVSESRFSQHALTETLPLQILFSATFFVSVGMLLDLGFLVQNLPIVVAAVATVLIIKIATTWISVRTLGYATPIAAASALTLGQIGEFSFVLERAGREVGLFPAAAGTAGSQAFIATTVILMVATPLLMRLGSRLSDRIVERRETGSMPDDLETQLADHELDLEDHVIVAGYGRAARSLVRILAGSGIPYVITTLSPDGANEAETEGLPVVRGDASKLFLLTHVGIQRAKMLVIADDNPSTAHRITSVARQQNPTMRIVVRTRYSIDAEELLQAGADEVISEEFESVVQLFGEVLREYRVDAEKIERLEDLARKNGYAAMTSEQLKVENSEFACKPGDDCYDSRTVTIRDGSPAAGMTLGELGLGDRGDLVVKELIRNAAPIDVSPQTTLLPGDELIIAGSTQAFAGNAAKFRAGTAQANIQADGGNAVAVGFASRTADPSREPAIDTEKEYLYQSKADESVCGHLDQIRPVFPSAAGCEECLADGDDWVHLRMCLTCGHVGCCDTSKNKHATAHFREAGHQLMTSMEPGEDWGWCFVDEEYI